MSETYPNLREYLKGAVLADRIRKAKRPEEWARWAILISFLVMLAMGAFRGMSPWFVAPLVLVLSWVVPYALASKRRRTWSLTKHFVGSIKEELAKIVRGQFRKGLLSERLTQGQMNAVEDIARDVQTISMIAVEARLNAGHQPLLSPELNSTSEIADEQFRAVLYAVIRAVMMDRPLSKSENEWVLATRDTMGELAAGAATIAQAGATDAYEARLSALRECLGNLRALAEAQKEVDSFSSLSVQDRAK